MSDEQNPQGEAVEVFDAGGTPVGRGELRDGSLVLNNRVVPPENIDHLDMRGIYLKPNVRFSETTRETMPLDHQQDVFDRLDERGDQP